MATEWEAVKENAAPIERGRNPLKLSKTSDGMTERERKNNERTRSHFERLVRKSEESNAAVDGSDRDDGTEDDPLVHWLSYIKFVQDAYPADTQASFLLMERCTRALVGVDQYKEDVRFLRVCILYADRTSSPSDVFKFLHHRKVGSRTSLFWVAWAWVAEKAGDYPFAEKVFKKALSKGAEPKKLLEDRHKQFQRRMSRHWLNASESNDGDAANENSVDTGGRRGRLTSLTTSGARYNQRSRLGNEIVPNDENGNPNLSRRGRRGGGRSATTSVSHSTAPAGVPPSIGRRRANGNGNVASDGGAFSIYVDEDAEAQEGYNLDVSLATSSLNRNLIIASDGDRKKENEGTAEQWNARGGLSSAPDEDSAPTFVSRRQRPGAAAAAPAFEVFVDEDCATKDEEAKLASQVEHAEQNGRSLRERLDGGLVDKLTKDPLRYVENPEKYAKDKRLHEHGGRQHKETSKGSRSALSGSVSRTGTATAPAPSSDSQLGPRHVLGKDSNGQERCVEESRAIAKYFTLAPSTANFSLLAMDDGASEMSVMEEIDESVDMEDVTNSEGIDFNAEKKDPVPATIYRGQKSETGEKSAGKAKMPRRVLFAESKTVINSSTVSSQAGADVSCASSTINERDAVGGDVRAEEETINTKFARGELSLMFSSPAVNASNGSILDASSAHQKSLSKPLFSVRTCKRKPLSESPPPNQCQNDEDGDEDGDTATFSVMANLIDADCHEVNNSITAAAHSGAENTCANDPTLAAKPIVDSRNDCKSPQVAVRGFEIFCDDEENENDQEESQKAATKNLAFEKKSSCTLVGKRAPFEIHSDDPDPCDSNENGGNCEDEGDTATFSVFGDAMECLGSSGRPIQTTSDLPKATVDGRGECGAFSIFEDDAIEANADNDALHRKDQSFPQDGFTPQPSTRRDVLTGPRFGDISRIVPDDVDASHPRLMPSPAVSLMSDHRKLRGECEAVEYEMLHKDDISRALLEALDEASIQSRRGNRQKKRSVENRQTSSLPPSLKLKQKAPTRGSEIILTDTSFVIERELGRGVNGTVLLGRTKDRDDSASSGSDHRSCIAVKIQAPVGCLALEYALLTRLQKRIPQSQNKRPRKREKTPNESEDVPYPFPKAVSFVAYKDGGLLGMTAASQSGTNLVNVVNAHKRYGGRQVPELIAIYYTMKMLLHLEALHLQGNILHCDVKPDNWVLTESKSPFDSGIGLIEGSDLMLVDFGRAIDLLAVDKSDPLKVTFIGSAAAQDMACVAMREGRSWGMDLDTHGLCASAYVLLYGEHMEITKDSSGRWRLSKPLRRYWKKELWNNLFDTLLNHNPEVAHGRRLRALRKSFESCLDEGSRKQELVAHLRQQAVLLKSAG